MRSFSESSSSVTPVSMVSSNAGVETRVPHVNHAIAGDEVAFDVRVALDEGGKDWCQEQVGRFDGDIQAHEIGPACRCALRAACLKAIISAAARQLAAEPCAQPDVSLHGQIIMQYVHLGRSGLKVSRLCLGTMNFGDATDESTAFGIMDQAIDSGINFFDTADVYGGPQSPTMAKGFGISEEIIGHWLAQGGGRRDKIVLATKAYQPMDVGPNDKYLSAYHIRRACEASLKRL